MVAELEALGSPESLSDLRKRLAPDKAAIGMRMRDLLRGGEGAHGAAARRGRPAAWLA
jgi:hypothetical protein